MSIPVARRTLVITPTYNERASIEEVVARVLAGPVQVDLLVVDDGSPDGTGQVADRLAAAHPEVHVLHRARKQGLGSAYRAGFRWGLARDYRVFVEMDADLSHDPATLPDLVAATHHADLVVGSRYVDGGATRNWPWHRRLLSRWGNLYVQMVTGVPVRDATSGYRAFQRAVLEELDVESLRSEGYSFQLETVLRAWREGFVLSEVPITFVERSSGTSKISRAIVLEAVWRVLLWGLRGPRRGGRVHRRSVVTAGG
ncbi:MAG TPA: polyprenol monophosphomannose synthase [Nitriliruptorales bacterium]|nr:polyprenol monophosphomannose synthase [Nitriliruptorales bacterium]